MNNKTRTWRVNGWRLGLCLLVLGLAGDSWLVSTHAAGNNASTTNKAPVSSGDVLLPTKPGELPAAIARLEPEDVVGRIKLGQWCKFQQMWEPMADLAREALRIDPEAKGAYDLLREYDKNVQLPDEKEAGETLAQAAQDIVGHSFKYRQTRHFILAYDTSDTFAASRGGAMEQAYDSFMFSFTMKALRPAFLKKRLHVILIKDRRNFTLYAQKVDGFVMTWASGYYSTRTNRSCFFDDATSPAEQENQRKLAELRALVVEYTNKANAAQSAGQPQIANEIRRRRDILSQEALRIGNVLNRLINDVNTMKTVHEACHQLAFNTGIQKRTVDYPLWVSEGLACSFEEPDRMGVRGPTIVNPARLRTLREAFAKKQKLSIESVLNPNMTKNSSDDDGNSATGTSQGKDRGNIGGGLAGGTQEEVTFFYAQSWALFHYLYKTNRAGMEKFLLAYRDQKPMRALPPEMHRKIFDDCFGSDLEKLETKWQKYLQSIR